MSKQLIVLVHGMGTHPEGQITKEFKSALAERAKSFGMTDLSFLEQVDYKEFNYSNKFDMIRKQFAENAEARKKGFKYLSGSGVSGSLLKQLTDFEVNLSKDEFLYTHWLDVILYSTTYFGEKIRHELITFLDELREKYNHQNIHVVCHSLGTAVVHDSLAKYYRIDSTPHDDIPDVKVGNFNLASLWTFANVSRMVNILNDLKNPYQSTVTTGNKGCTEFFFNSRHKYDPFTWYKSYDREMDDKVSQINTVFRKANTHDFYEYITEPNTSRWILARIYNKSVSNEDFEKGVDKYKEDTINDEVDELKVIVDGLIASPDIESVKKAIDQFKVIEKKIDELSSEL